MGEVQRDSAERRNCTISIATERRPDGTWAAVAKVNRDTGGAVEVTRVAIGEGPPLSFQTVEEACTYAREAAEQWIDQNVPVDSVPGPS